MKKRGLSLAVIALLLHVLSGCTLPTGIIASDYMTAEDYLTNNLQLINKYGTDYTFEIVGGGGGGESNGLRYSGEMKFYVIVNSVDTYTLSLKTDKHRNWIVEGLLLTSCEYECEELQFSFSERSTENYYVANGELQRNGTTIPVLVSLGFHSLKVEDANLRNQYETEWAAVSESLWEDSDKNSKELEKWHERENACTLFICDVESNFDEFTATVQPEYQDYLGKDTTVLHFSKVDETP